MSCLGRSKQFHLLCPSWYLKLVAVERRRFIESQLFVGDAETVAAQLGEFAGTAHAAAEAAVVDLAAAAITQTVQHVVGLGRYVVAQPLLEQVTHLARQSQ